ncbi:hypothetical protein C4588_06515 [Candidatus Parcubacteria bacterium]|nr:MAG: hypothetical protein C4588_06515 [Candidatus Parcubacteria bacterium]
MFNIYHGLWMLEWDYIGEGFSGDYDPSDEEDIKLMRATLFVKKGDDYEEVDNCSFCTLVPVTTPVKLLHALSQALFVAISTRLEEPYQDTLVSNLMMQWTWETDISPES